MWDHGGSDNNSGTLEGRHYTRSDELSTISGDLPTYRQVIQTIQKEEMPPSYYDVSIKT